MNGTASAGWEHLGVNTGSTSFRGAGGSNASADFRTYTVGLSAAYQLDFWGHNQAHRASLVAAAEFSRFDQRTALQF